MNTRLTPATRLAALLAAGTALATAALAPRRRPAPLVHTGPTPAEAARHLGAAPAAGMSPPRPLTASFVAASTTPARRGRTPKYPLPTDTELLAMIGSLGGASVPELTERLDLNDAQQRRLRERFGAMVDTGLLRRSATRPAVFTPTPAARP